MGGLIVLHPAAPDPALHHWMATAQAYRPLLPISVTPTLVPDVGRMRYAGQVGRDLVETAIFIAVESTPSLRQVARGVAMVRLLAEEQPINVERVIWFDALRGKDVTVPNRLLHAMLAGNRRHEQALWGPQAPWLGLHPLCIAWHSALQKGDYWGETVSPILRRRHDEVLVCQHAIVTAEGENVQWRV